MRMFRLQILALTLFAAVSLKASTPTVTLYPPVDPITKKYSEGKSCFSFKRGLLKEVTNSNNDWDLGYGFLSIDQQDWFRLHFARENRSVIKDLGQLKWDEPLTIPVLEPRPTVPNGQKPSVTIDASGDTGKAWAQNTQIFAKVVLGHMYLLHVKDEANDFYVMFRVEDFEQNKRCMISWRMIPAPKASEGSQHSHPF